MPGLLACLALRFDSAKLLETKSVQDSAVAAASAFQASLAASPVISFNPKTSCCCQESVSRHKRHSVYQSVTFPLMLLQSTDAMIFSIPQAQKDVSFHRRKNFHASLSG